MVTDSATVTMESLYKLPSLFRKTPTISPAPKFGSICPKTREWPYLRNFMFGSRVGFSATADVMAQFPVRTNPRWRPPPSWIISNSHISAMAHIRYSAHRAVIFAIAQLSCYPHMMLSIARCMLSSVTIWYLVRTAKRIVNFFIKACYPHHIRLVYCEL